MSRLTPEQKAQNKVRTAARDATFRARKKAFQTAMKTAEAALEQTPEHKALTIANDALEAARVRRNQREDELRAQIRALEIEIEGLRKSTALDDLNEKRKDAVDAYFGLKRNTLAAVDAQFPDVSHIYSAAQWEALGHYKPENENSVS